MSLSPFHLAFPVDDLEAARAFYTEVLDCRTGRESETWIDFDFRGHQIVAHLVDESHAAQCNDVDGKEIPAFHFGLVLGMQEWKELVQRLREHDVDFLVDPYVRFEGDVGEQATCFVRDPAGNAIEIKALRNLDQLFERGGE